jgi:hypothetical protein
LFKRNKAQVYLSDDVLERIKQVAERTGMSVSEYLGKVGERDSKDEQEEYEANKRLAADRQQRYEETFDEPFPEAVAEPTPTLAPTPEPAAAKDPGRAMSWEEYLVEEKAALQAHRTRLHRLKHCPHAKAAPGEICRKCNQLVKPRGSQGRVLTKPPFRFSIPQGKGGL